MNPSFELDVAVFPDFELFANVCRQGLSVVYPFKSMDSADPFGWKFGSGWPPSYSAYGRMRSLLALQDAISLKPQRVLEVAAGGAGLAACLTKQGCVVTVNDLIEQASRESIEEFSCASDLRFIPGNLFDLSPADIGKFDLVIACEVIEHVAHPLALLRHLKQFLALDGRILLTTPNGSHFRNKLPTLNDIENFDDLESQQFKPDADGHLFLFTPQEFIDLAAEAGLQIERLNCWGTPLLTGHFGFRFFAGHFAMSIAYQAELLVQRLKSKKRERVCAELSAVLKSA